MSGSYVPVSSAFTPPQDCTCSCSCTQSAGVSDNPVRYFNGEIRLTVDDLPSPGFGMAWGHQRTYSNQLSSNANFGNGYNWLVDQWSHIVEFEDSSVEVLFNPLLAYWFDLVDGVYVARFGAKQTLTQVGDQLVLTFPDGELWTYFGFDDPTAAGKLASVTSVGGVVMSLTYNSDGTVAQSSRSSGETLEQFTYTYGDSGASAGRLTSVTLTRGGTNITRAVYTYYDGTGTFGNLGDLFTVETDTYDPTGPAWISTGTTLYRYYQAGDSGGFEHGLQYVIQPATYQLMEAASLDPQTEPDSTLDGYADFKFTYDNATDQRVATETVNAGTEAYTFTYTPSGIVDDFGNWSMKTVEVSPDLSNRIVYTNFIGQVVLSELNDGVSETTNRWIDYYEYDENAHEVMHCLPSAINMSGTPYSPSDSNLDVQINAETGLIHTKTYYPSDSAIAPGYLEYEGLQQGSDAVATARLKYLEYTSNTVGLATTYPVASSTVYRTAPASAAIVTSFGYTWGFGTNQPSQIITTYPPISTGQNGPGTGTAITRTAVFDEYGNAIWQKDERGFITYQAFDITLGVVTQSILDYDTTASHIGYPTCPWTTPSGEGMDLTSDFLYDPQGRPTQSLGPIHTVDLSGTATAIRTASWTVYQDGEDQVWTAQGYQTTAGTPVVTLVNPVSITQFDDGGRVIGQIAATRGSTSGPLSASDSYPQTSYVRWSTTLYNAANEIVSTQVYFDIPSSGIGSSGTNYNETVYGYDSMGRGNMTKTPSLTIVRTVYDLRDQVISTWVGTNDMGESDSDPSDGGTPPNNMLCVSQNQYDGGNPGLDGLLTQATALVDTDSGNDRVVTLGYDWRDRQTSVAGALSYFILRTFDNLDRVVKLNRMDTSASGTMLTQSKTVFDDIGRVYQTANYEVVSGTPSNPQTSNNWYDLSGNLIKSQPAGSNAWVKMTYDGVSRTIASYAGYSTGTVNYAEAGSVAESIVFEQTFTTFDDASNVIEIASYQRDYNAPATGSGSLGSLNGPGGSDPTARATFVAIYPDGIGRTANTADYGTNGNSSFSRPSICGTRSATLLITTNVFDQTGVIVQLVDPAATVTNQVFDDAGRRTSLVLNYISGGTGADQNQTTNWTYNPDSNVATMTAVNAETENQVTTYGYGITVSGGSTLNSNSPLQSVTYPDSGTVSVQYNRQGDVILRTDRNATVHAYAFDLLGQPSTDSVTAVGSGVDSTVLQIAVTYEIRGMVQNITSYSSASGTGVVNDVQRLYNGFRQLITEYQEHGGAVNTSTSLKVQYSFADGSANTIRLTGVSYPNGNVVGVSYGSSGSVSDLLSRVDSLFWPSGLSSLQVVQYNYLGLGTPVQVTYPQPQVQYDLAVAIGVNLYTGLDEFGRVIDLRWCKLGSSSSSSSSGFPDADDLVHLLYGYDQASNRLWRQDVVAGPANLDELYMNDGLYCLQEMQRGSLTDGGSSITDVDFQQVWTLDPTGNWGEFKEYANGSTLSLDQTRTSNTVNEITEFTTGTGTGWSLPEYDAAGNMISMPQPNSLSDAYTGIFDAWNRLAKLGTGSGDEFVPVQVNKYDGRNFRITRLTYSGGELTETRGFYQSLSWQVLEERVSGTPERQYVWGLRYIDDLVLRDRSNEGTLNERLYGLQDANWNMVALCDESGDVQERFNYTAYGVPTALNPHFSAPYTGTDYDWTVLYTGRELDTATGIYDYRRRDYHPLLGVFVSRDPIESDPNPYRYVGNRAVNATDPSGKVKREVSCVFTDGSSNWGETVIAETSETPAQACARRAAGWVTSWTVLSSAEGPYGTQQHVDYGGTYESDYRDLRVKCAACALDPVGAQATCRTAISLRAGGLMGAENITALGEGIVGVAAMGAGVKLVTSGAGTVVGIVLIAVGVLITIKAISDANTAVNIGEAANAAAIRYCNCASIAE